VNARQAVVDGIEVVRLADEAHQLEMSIAPSIGNMAYEIKAGGKNILWFPFRSPGELEAAPRLCGVPFLAPWANRIDGESYWDGGFVGNPTITPLIRECKSQDTILIPINPIKRAEVPRTASDILNRLNEVSFNAVALKELRMIALLRQVADPGHTEGAQWARMRIHLVRNEIVNDLGASSKLNAEWAFLSHLRDEGRKSAQAFLEAHALDLGHRSTADLDVMLEGV